MAVEVLAAEATAVEMSAGETAALDAGSDAWLPSWPWFAGDAEQPQIGALAAKVAAVDMELVVWKYQRV